VIATSVLFLAAAIATFLVGVFSTGLQMIGASIGCSVAAAVLLLVGVMRDSRKRPVVAPSGMSVSAPEMESIVSPAVPEQYPDMEPVPALETEYASAEPLDLKREDFYGTPETESYDIAPTPAPVTRARKPATRKPAARKPAAKKSAAKRPAAKKAAPKKAAARKPAAKSTAKKAAPKKAAPRKSSSR